MNIHIWIVGQKLHNHGSLPFPHLYKYRVKQHLVWGPQSASRNKDHLGNEAETQTQEHLPDMSWYSKHLQYNE